MASAGGEVVRSFSLALSLAAVGAGLITGYVVGSVTRNGLQSLAQLGSDTADAAEDAVVGALGLDELDFNLDLGPGGIGIEVP